MKNVLSSKAEANKRTKDQHHSRFPSFLPLCLIDNLAGASLRTDTCTKPADLHQHRLQSPPPPPPPPEEIRGHVSLLSVDLVSFLCLFHPFSSPPPPPPLGEFDPGPGW